MEFHTKGSMKDSGLHCPPWHSYTQPASLIQAPGQSVEGNQCFQKPPCLCVLDIFSKKGSPALWRHLCLSWYAGMRDSSLGPQAFHV